MKLTNKYLTLSMVILLIISSFISTSILSSISSSALSFQSSEYLSFTLNPTINITITGGDLSISSLTPGDSKDSNIITVTAASNAISGYSMSSTVGTSTNASTELRRNGNDTTNKFTSITENKASLANFDDNTNTWGYSYSTDSGTTWQSGDITGTGASAPQAGYNGLPLYTSASSIKLINSTTNGSSSIQFKIGAKTLATQVAGEYTNVINFIGVANPNPEPIYMQDATLADCGKDMVDSRDNNVYSTALIGDGCWMTTNLDLPGGTAISANDTDVTSEYINNFTTSNNLTKVGNTIVLPASSTSGFDTNDYSYVYNSGNNSTNCSSVGCHSYYSWDAATLGSGRSISTGNTDAPHSICPKGWHLPNTKTGTDSSSDYRALMITLGGSASIAIYDDSTVPTGATIYNGLSNTPFNFIRAGRYYDSEFTNGGSAGYYWSATAGNRDGARFLFIYSTYIDPAYLNYRSYGRSVRCLFGD